MAGLVFIYIFLIFDVSIIYIHGYSHCYDPNNKGMYYGTIAITTSGRHCQNWADQSPQAHAYTNDAKFPFDGSVALANNYCRDPDFNYVPWCYTMDPTVRWEVCDIPACTNLPCGSSEQAGASSPATLTSSFDTDTGVNFLATSYTIPCCGTVKKWKLYVRKAGTIRLQVWRLDSATGNYVLMGENTYTFNVGHENTYQEQTVSTNDKISVQEGDIIGWHTDTEAMITYAAGTTDNNLLLTTSAPSVTESVDFSPATVHDNRDYAIGVDIDPNYAPYFTNSDSTATATESSTLYPVGTAVFALSVTDDDPDDVAGLVVTMVTSSTYFELNPTTLEIQVKSSPLSVGSHELKFEVEDDCGEKGLFTVTVTVTKDPVNINNLPDFGSVSESETAETLVFTLTFDSAGPHTCTIDSYVPTRAEGNPFLIKSGIGVYLKANADVRYSVATSYTLTITCDDGSTTDTKDLIVNIEPNSSPVFQSWTGAVTIDGSTTGNGDIVYTATVTDAESDPVTMAITSCTPSPCIFDINNDGELSTNQDLALHQISSYDVYLSADDGFSTVTSSLLTVTITGLNDKPVLTNLGVSQTVSENTAAGVLVYQVSCTDGDGDTQTFTATYAPAACSSLFTIGASDGGITTLASLDYETVAATSCVLTVTANDGLMDSDPDTLTLPILDIDEVPVFSSNGYTISTPEVTSGTVLPNPGITVTDPEGTAITLSLSCAADPGYLSVDSATKLVTMVTEYDLDPATASHTINCILTATDATSQTSTVPLAVTVTDENDNTPTFTQGMYTINILNTQGLGVIGSVAATDADSTSPNNLITYSLSGSTKFIIDASGNIELTGDVTGDTGITTYTLTATATDGGTTPNAGTTVVQVLVSDAATITTTTTTTTSASVVVSSSDSGFFSSTLNIIWFTLAIALATFVFVAGGYMLYRWCRSPKHSGRNLYENPNNAHKETPIEKNDDSNPAKQNQDNSSMRKRSLSESYKRPSSGDSGIQISVRTPPTPANTRFQPLSVQPADDSFTSADMTSPRTNYLNMHDIREWKLEQGQWRQALFAGRLKY